MYYMDFSLSTYCLFNEPLKTALDTLSQYATHLELMNEAMHKAEDVKLLQNYPVSYTIHSPFINMNISSPKEEERIHSIQRIEESIDLAAEIEAKYVVVHPGTYNENSSKEKATQLMIESLNTLQTRARDCGITLVLENMGNWTDWGINLLQTPEEIPTGIEFCLDIGHANLCGNLEKFLQKPITHIHLHDNFGKDDTHSAIGLGNIPLKIVLDAIKKNKIAHPVIECQTLNEALSSLKTLKSH